MRFFHEDYLSGESPSVGVEHTYTLKKSGPLREPEIAFLRLVSRRKPKMSL